MWSMIFAVAAGGAAGSVLRFLVTQQMLRVGSSDFPYGTLLVNVLGSLFIGLFARWFSGPETNTVARAALTVGFCGGFTTFSTYSAELVLLVEQGRAMRALLYVAGSTSLSLAATIAGLSLGGKLASR